MKTFLYGRNAVRSRLINNQVYKLFIRNNFQDQEILILAKEQGIDIEFCQNSVLNEMVKSDKHQGVVALIERFAYTPLDDLIAYSKSQSKPFLLLLAGLEDPHNLGAIARTADAFSVDGIIIPKDRSVQVTGAALKVATGAFDFVKVSQVTNLNQTLTTLKKAGYWIVGAEGESDTNYMDLSYDFPLVLIIGSEGKGVPKLLLKNSDYRVKIPMTGHVNSLNASVATAILIAGIIQKREN
ncbi:MAG: 23S rRNA (guanosine(2251)-2'-O)-methyltransferase RlmB [Bacilli bacterium]|jgi:23S rRNA (guanosine2251-2'-O)-methyltransferase